MSDLKLEHKIARLYYMDGLSQSEIAKKLSVSVASVSRGLSRARESGIVKISIAEVKDNFDELEAAIEKRYGLNECLITPGYQGDDLDRQNLAGALREMLPRILPMHGTLGVSWGETMKAVGEALSVPTPLETDVIPMVGAMGTVETGIYPNSIARIFADKLGGRAFLVNAPAVNDSPELCRSLYDSRGFASVREIWDRIDVGLVSCSGIEVESSMARNAIFTSADLKTMGEAGAVAAINFSFVDAEGQAVNREVTDRILHIPLEEMKKLDHVVLIASGDAKTGAIRAVLKGGWVTALITDAHSAEQLL